LVGPSEEAVTRTPVADKDYQVGQQTDIVRKLNAAAV
jgi:hypothetical protein